MILMYFVIGVELVSTLKFLLESGGLSLDVFGYLEYIDSINNPVALGLFDESFKEDQSGHYTFLFEIAASSIVILLAQEAALISLYGQYQIHTIKRHSDQKSLFEVAFEAKNYSFIAFLMKYCGSDFDFNPQALPQLAFDVLEQEPDLFTHCLNHLSPAGQNQLLHSLITSKPDDKIIVILNQLFSKMSTLAIEQTYSVAIMSGYGARVEPSIPLILDTKVRKRLDRQLDAFRPLSEDEAEYRDRVTIIVALDDLLNLIKKSAPNLKLIQKLLHDRAMVPFKVEDLFRLFHATQGKPAILQMICNHYALPLGIQEYQTCFRG